MILTTVFATNHGFAREVFRFESISTKPSLREEAIVALVAIPGQ